MRFLPLFQFDTRLLSSKHPILFSTLHVERNGQKWKTYFSAPLNAKKKHQLEHKNQIRKWRYLECWVLEYERLYLILGFEHMKVKGYLNFNKNIENVENFCLPLTGYLNTKLSFPNSIFVLMTSWKCVPHIYFTFPQDFCTPLFRNNLIYFFIINECMYNKLSACGRAKNTQLP